MYGLKRPMLYQLSYALAMRESRHFCATLYYDCTGMGLEWGSLSMEPL